MRARRKSIVQFNYEQSSWIFQTRTNTALVHFFSLHQMQHQLIQFRSQAFLSRARFFFGWWIDSIVGSGRTCHAQSWTVYSSQFFFVLLIRNIQFYVEQFGIKWTPKKMKKMPAICLPNEQISNQKYLIKMFFTKFFWFTSISKQRVARKVAENVIDWAHCY